LEKKVATKKVCKGITPAGPCKRKAQKDSKFCYQHNPEKPPQQKAKKVLAGLEKAGEEMLSQVIPRQELSGPEFAKYEIAKRIAHTLAQSNLVPEPYRGRPNDVFVAINMGSELGMEPFQAIQSIAVIEGKPCLYGDGLIGVVRASPKCLWIKETISDDGKTATCETQRKGDPQTISATYSMADAVQAGISTKRNWEKHPKRMLQMRARAYCLRDAYPDLLKGLGVVEERQDHDDSPPPITEYTLPEPANDTSSGDSDTEVTLAQVERAMNQSDSMQQLLEAGNLAKSLNPTDQGVARITYKKMKTALLDTGEQ
jgi:hypothetical protein